MQQAIRLCNRPSGLRNRPRPVVGQREGTYTHCVHRFTKVETKNVILVAITFSVECVIIYNFSIF